MKCYLMQKPKHKISAENKKKLQNIVNKYMASSLIVGHEKALEILKKDAERRKQ